MGLGLENNEPELILIDNNFEASKVRILKNTSEYIDYKFDYFPVSLENKGNFFRKLRGVPLCIWNLE